MKIKEEPKYLIELDKDEAAILRELVKNEQSTDESPEVRELRLAIFTSIQV